MHEMLLKFSTFILDLSLGSIREGRCCSLKTAILTVRDAFSNSTATNSENSLCWLCSQENSTCLRDMPVVHNQDSKSDCSCFLGS